MVKEDLLNVLNVDYVYWNISKYHRLVAIEDWVAEKENRLIPIKLDKKSLYEP